MQECVVFLLLLCTLCVSGLTNSEERELVLSGDVDIIDEKLRELPGGVLIPREPETLPLPAMDRLQFPSSQHPQLNKQRSSVRVIPEGIQNIREAVKTMHDRIRSPSYNHRRLHNPSQSSSSAYQSIHRLSRTNPNRQSFDKPHRMLSTSTPSALEIGLKRIEILSSRAGFNLSSVPRRTQLQIVTRLADKLPLKYSSVIIQSLKDNDQSVYAYLPEPSRDPLIEDKPVFLSHFLNQDQEQDVFEDKPHVENIDKRVDHSMISIANDDNGGYQGYHVDADEEAESGLVLSLAVPLIESTKLPIPEMLIGDKPEIKQKLSSFNVHSWGKPTRVVLTTPTTTTTTTARSTTTTTARSTTTTPTTTTTTTASKPSREAKALSGGKPIRVSIISKDNVVVGPAQTEEDPSAPAQYDHVMEESIAHEDHVVSEEPMNSTALKYVSVEPLSNSNRTNLLFELETPADSDYDLTEAEISAMVKELKRYEEEEQAVASGGAGGSAGGGSQSQGADNSLEFDYSRLLTPHPLEYPDHPDHPEGAADELLKDVSGTGSPSPASTTQMSRLQPLFRNQHFHKLPPYLLQRLQQQRPRMPPPPPPPRHPHPHIHHNQRPQQMMRPQPPPHPMRINDVKVSSMPKSFNKECDYFSNELCLLVQDYPIEAISSAIESNPELSLSLLPREESTNSKDQELPSSENKLAGEGGFLCPSKVAYGKIKKAKSSSSGKWKFIVNYGDKTQTLRIEKCLTPGDRCSYVQGHYRTACTQVYNYHRLLSWDSENGLHMDMYKVPTCCTCHVQGYYSPNQQQNHQQSPANRRTMMVNHPQPNHPPFFNGHNGHNRFARNRFPNNRPPMPQQFNKPIVMATTTIKPTETTDDLQDLLKQYSALRDKISKKKQGHSQQLTTTSTRSDRMLKSLNLLENVLLRKRKRSNVNNNNKIVELKRLLRRFKEKKLRSGRAMTSKSDLKKELKNKRLAWLLKAIKNKKMQKKQKNIQDKVNYNYHPIMDYYNRAAKAQKN